MPQDDTVLVEVVDIDTDEARLLESQQISEMQERYGGSGPSRLDPSDFDAPFGCFLLARVDGLAVGCGGFRKLDTATAEIKRMYVDSDFRRRGIGRRILRDLQNKAKDAGYREVWLETGIYQPESISLYESEGYTRMQPYGEFNDDPRSVCFRRALS